MPGHVRKRGKRSWEYMANVGMAADARQLEALLDSTREERLPPLASALHDRTATRRVPFAL